MVEVSPRFRVALVAHARWDFIYTTLHGVLSYMDRTNRWELIGRANLPVFDDQPFDVRDVDGVIGFPSDLEPHLDSLLNANVHVVSFGGGRCPVTLPQVVNDDVAVGRMGAEHLLARGLPHLGFFGVTTIPYSQQRYEGFRQVVEDRARRPCHLMDLDDRLDADPLLREWILRVPKPLAVMADCDNRGRHLIAAVRRAGLRVPEDVAVLGVDNDRWLSHLAATPMSSVELDWHRVGFEAADLLNTFMTEREPEPPRPVPPLRVVVRRSSDIVLHDDPVVTRALSYIRDHLSDRLSVEDVTEAAGVSRRTLENHLKREVGRTPLAAIRGARVEEAKRLLEGSDQSMYTIARACGFSSQAVFFTSFKRETGMTPGEFRRQSRLA